MPEVNFSLRWPDGSTQDCASPSRTIEQALATSASYPVAELVRRAHEALAAGSERIRRQHGVACSMAAATADAIAGRARGQEGRVVVERIWRADEPARAAAADQLDGHVACVIVGGGQAGLAMSYELTRAGVEHVVLERYRIAHSWREERWDAFCLVTPNWQCQLPGHPYAGDDPDGFMLKDEIVAYVESFAGSFDTPVHEGVAVHRVAAAETGFRVETSHGELTCDQVVLAVGGYHVPRIPVLGSALPPTVTQVHSARYRSPHALPDGAVLVVGSGQSGAQIAEDLHLAGREVHMAVGTAPRVARRHRGRDVVAWLADMGHYDMSIDDHPEGNAARKEANHYVTGRGGGRDIDLRRFAQEGMHLHGRLLGVDDGALRFAGDLRANLDGADAVKQRIEDGIDKWIAERGIDAPPGEPYIAEWAPAADEPTAVGLPEVSSVVWATGFTSDWSWVELPAFDGSGYPVHTRGVTTVPGLHVLGLPWLHTWGSGRFASVARDAAHLADAVTARAGAGAERAAA